MQILRVAFLVLFSILSLSACSNIKTKQDHVAQYNYAQLKTFAWKPNEVNGYGVKENDSLDKRIRTAVENHLLTKSYRLVDSFTPDFFIHYYVEVTPENGGDDISIEQLRSERHSSAKTNKTVLAEDYVEGTLLIDITIPVGNKLIWRSAGTQRITKSLSLKKTNALINKTVAEILQKFPPR